MVLSISCISLERIVIGKVTVHGRKWPTNLDEIRVGINVAGPQYSSNCVLSEERGVLSPSA